MSFQAFVEAMDNKLSTIEKTKFQAYFRAFDGQQKSYLTYSDYLLGLFVYLLIKNILFSFLFLRISSNGSKYFPWRYKIKIK